MLHLNNKREVRVTKPQIGQLLLAAELISSDELALALARQPMCGKPLGEILRDMQIIDHSGLRATLSIQDDLVCREGMITMAAGSRESLGALLLHARRITGEQLEQALAEQEETGGRLGDVFIRHGWLSAAELEAILAFQEQQGRVDSDSKLQLGTLLVSTGDLDSEHLDAAVNQQRKSAHKLGDVLVAAGYAKPEVVAKGLALQSKLMGAVLSSLLCVSAMMDSKPAMAAKSSHGMMAASMAISSVVSGSSRATHSRSPEESYQLAMKFLEGDGVEKNRARAMELLTESAKAGLASAQYSLGLMYMDDEEEDKGYTWLQKAITQGHEGARYAYNFMLNQDFGTGC